MNLHGNTQASDSSRGAERDAHAELLGAPRRISGAGYARMGFPAVMGCAERRVAVGAGEKLVATHAIEVGVHRLTPELSRPAAGWRTRASVAQARGRRHDAGSA